MRKIVLGFIITSLTSPLFSMQEENEITQFDDTELLMRIKLSLFKQLCVQALKCDELPLAPLQELLQKFKNEELVITKDSWTECRDVNEKVDYVDMTLKDGYHRLMMYIPIIERCEHNNDIGLFMINNKKIYLKESSFCTQNDIVETREKKRKEKEEDAAETGPVFKNLAYFLDYSSGKTIVELGEISFEEDNEQNEKRVKNVRQLEKDKEHHEKVEKEFQQLIDK